MKSNCRNHSPSRPVSASGRVFRMLGAALLSALLTACGSVLQSEEPIQRTLWLSHPGDVSALPARIEVSAVPGLTTNRVMVLNRQTELSPVAGLHWPGPIPQVVEAVLSSGQAPESASETAADEVDLELHLQAFFLDHRVAPLSARLDYRAALRCRGQHHPARRFSERLQWELDERSNAAISAGFNQLLSDLRASLREQIESVDCAAD